MNLQSPRLNLKAVSHVYLKEIHHLHSLPETDKFNTLGIPESIKNTEHLIETWIENQNTEPKTAYIFCAELIATRQFAGLIGLKMGKINYKIAEVWYKTHPDHWGKGFTTEALLTILKFGFMELGLHRIEAGCAVNNLVSIRVLEKAGFTREGRKREILPIRGNWVDNYFYSILEKEFASLNSG